MKTHNNSKQLSMFQPALSIYVRNLEKVGNEG